MAKNHIMLDLETLATTPNAQVLTIGAVKFDPNGDDFTDQSCETLYIKVDIESCNDLNLEINDDTVAWWGQQSEEAQEEAFGEEGRVSIQDAFAQLHKFCWGSKYVWSHGAAFDVPICENIFRKLNKAIPWQFWDVRCTRTLFDLGMVPYKPSVTAHHALVDAYNQVLGVQSITKILREHGINPFGR